MKVTLISTLPFLLSLIFSCSQKDYYSASNKNIQRFHTEVEENTAKYMLELNDDVLLLKSIVDLTKRETKLTEIYQDATALDKELTSIGNELKLIATLNRITLCSVLSKENDAAYQRFYKMDRNERDEIFSATVSRKVEEIRRKADSYANEGNNLQVQKFSLEVRDRMEAVSEQYS
ncbi:hypothetical protein [Marinoscillum sp. MHG1-6]|uniref:hypothetical protein n=1 Tax=Marinoscillum sp. MHG1-6 TaxID=2959627 RepID=UPI0021581787|nr:hypothetical protein [Marinoscillum sp. MHG1-6]